MTRKDYQLIAEALNTAYKRRSRRNPQQELLSDIVTELSYRLKGDNANFKAGKFTEAVYAGLDFSLEDEGVVEIKRVA
jgi:hypothetical protein